MDLCYTVDANLKGLLIYRTTVDAKFARLTIVAANLQDYSRLMLTLHDEPT